MRWTAARIAELQERLVAAYPDARCALTHGNPYELVAATILSAQCTDARVNLVTPAFFSRFPDPAALAVAEPAEVETLIRSTGFFRNKARNLVGMAQAVVARHGGEVPSDPAALGKLPGVGQKTANVVLANAFGVPALAVDTHIFRVARRLGLSAAKSPEKVEADLCRLFPRENWIELHHQLIFHGRRACHARLPDCAGCPLLEFCGVGQGKLVDPHSGSRLEARSLRKDEVEAYPKPHHPTAVERKEGRTASAQPMAAPIGARGGAPSQAASLKPDDGPQRIVSLVPSFTELVTQWGLAARLVGRTRYCVEPKWIRNTVPAVGGTKDPDLDVIRSLQPDLVLLETDENRRETAEALARMGIPILAFEIRTVADCARACAILGERLGVPARGASAARAIRQAASRPRRGPRALVLIWRDPWMVAGSDTYLGDLLRCAGFVPTGPDRYPTLTAADLQALAPEVVLLPSEPYRFTARHRKEVQALLPGAAVHLVEGRALTWYLSRTVDGIAALRELRNR